MDHLEGAGGHDGVFYLVDLLEGVCECVYICLHIMMSPLSQNYSSTQYVLVAFSELCVRFRASRSRYLVDVASDRAL